MYPPANKSVCKRAQLYCCCGDGQRRGEEWEEMFWTVKFPLTTFSSFQSIIIIIITAAWNIIIIYIIMYYLSKTPFRPNMAYPIRRAIAPIHFFVLLVHQKNRNFTLYQLLLVEDFIINTNPQLIPLVSPYPLDLKWRDRSHWSESVGLGNKSKQFCSKRCLNWNGEEVHSIEILLLLLLLLKLPLLLL